MLWHLVRCWRFGTVTGEITSCGITQSRLIINVQSGLCMDANGVNNGVGSAVIQNTCNLQWSQLWTWDASGWLRPD